MAARQTFTRDEALVHILEDEFDEVFFEGSDEEFGIMEEEVDDNDRMGMQSDEEEIQSVEDVNN